MRHVIRLDSTPAFRAEFTPEGYLRDKPVLTSTGIFEYHNPDGSIRRELRLPEEVFNDESLKSYQGQPVCVTHDAGLITKDNVHRNQIGTILSVGERSGNDVRADIIIYDTNEMKDCGLKELSLGYNLDLEETPGTWHGEHYDAIQRNIRINHLALVREARAGERARLNIDSRDSDIEILKGGKAMSKKIRNDGVLSPDELLKAIEEYKKRRQHEADSEDEVPVEEPEVKKPEAKELPDDATIEEKIEVVKGRRDRRDEEGDPEDAEEALGVIANQDEDISTLFDIIDTLLAEREFKEAKKADADDEEVPAEEALTEEEELVEDEDEEDAPVDEELLKEDCGKNCDAEDDEEEIDPFAEEEEEEVVEDADDEEVAPVEEEEEEEFIDEKPIKLNTDSIDKIVRTRIELGMIGRKLNMDGLEKLSIRQAKKAIIKAVRPQMRLDGKSATYINAAYNMAVEEAQSKSKKTTRDQKKQMFTKTVNVDSKESADSAEAAYKRMVERQTNRI